MNIRTVRSSDGRTGRYGKTTVKFGGDATRSVVCLRLLDKNNLALDLKHSASEVWLLGPKLRDLDKNNLASAQILTLPSLSILPATMGPS
jgi:hypothetical protein